MITIIRTMKVIFLRRSRTTPMRAGTSHSKEGTVFCRESSCRSGSHTPTMRRERGMGALEYVPTTGPKEEAGDIVRIDRMVEFASNILKNRERAHLHMDDNISAKQLLLLGTSAGGARAKAVIAWNEETGDIRSGQIPAGKGYGYWIIKFDGVDSNGDQMIKSFFDYAQGE